MSTYNRNGATVTVTQASSWTVTDKVLSTNQINSGFESNIDSLSFSGGARKGKSSVIAKVVIEADSGKYFSTPPRLKSKSRKLSLRLRDKLNQRLTVGDGIFFTSYTFDIVFNGSSLLSSTNRLNASIVYVTKTIPTVETKINDIVFGNENLSAKGETRSIRVYGEKGATFGLAINESLENRITIGDEVVKVYDNKNTDESILRNLGNKTKYNYGKKIEVTRGVIPSSGVFAFDQEFPSTIIVNTETTQAHTSTTKLKFKNLSGVKRGDRFYYPGLDPNIKISVSVLDPDGDDPNECTLDASISSLAKSSKCRFERDRVYAIDIVPRLTATLGPNIPTTDPEYRLYQYQNPTLKIAHTLTSGNLTVAEYNGVATGLAENADHEIYYTGVANKLYTQVPSDIKHKFSVNLKVTQSSGAFSSKILPVFSNKVRKIFPKRADNSKGEFTTNPNPVISNWTNSISKSNGGTVLNITSIRISATGSTTIYLSYNVEIFRWGSESVKMELPLDTFLINP